MATTNIRRHDVCYVPGQDSSLGVRKRRPHYVCLSHRGHMVEEGNSAEDQEHTQTK